MINYQVHYEYVRTDMVWVQRGMRTIKARNEVEAIIKVKSVVQGSFGHWIDHLASEEAI